MRKFLLSAAVCLAALGAQAQTWTAPATWSKTITAVSDAKELAGINTTVAPDGSVVVSGTYNQALTFGSTTLNNDDAMTSAYIAKYNADGSEAWAASIYGSSIIRAIDTDYAGNIYVAGNFADEVVFSSTDGNSKTAKGMADVVDYMVSAFIAKYDKNGALKVVKTIIPTADAAIVESFMYFPMSSDVFFNPTKIQVDGDKVYVSAMYTGDVAFDNVKWEGSYVNVFGFMYMDVASAGILSLNVSDLGGAESVANLQAKDNVTFDVQYNPQSVCFTAKDGVVYAGFIAQGEETLTTAKGAEAISAVFPGDGNVEHAYVFSKINGGETLTKVCHLNAHSLGYATDAVEAMIVEGGDLYIGGVALQQLPFDTAQYAKGSGDVFVAKLNADNLETVWATLSGYDEGAVNEKEEAFGNMTVSGGKVFVNGADQTKSDSLVKALSYNFANDGTVTVADGTDYVAISDMWGNAVSTVVVEGASLNISLFGDAKTGIENVEEETVITGDSKAYNLKGQYVGTVSELTKGLYIVEGKKIIIR